jgi:hypothetical protein
MVSTNPRYVLVTPVKNEKAMLESLRDCVLSQTLKPQAWILVNDESSDGSLEEIRQWCLSDDSIRITESKDHALLPWYRYGAVVAVGVREALGVLPGEFSHEYVGVLDADTCVEANYFRSLIEAMQKDNRSMISTGLISTINGSLHEQKPLPRGCARVYRASFLRELGGFPLTPAPDTVLEVKAANRGHTLLVIPGARGIHRRGSTTATGHSGNVTMGIIHHALGMDFASALLVGVLLGTSRGFSSSHYYIKGYLEGMKNRHLRVTDSEILSYYDRAWTRLFENGKAVRAAFGYAQWGL